MLFHHLDIDSDPCHCLSAQNPYIDFLLCHSLCRTDFYYVHKFFFQYGKTFSYKQVFMVSLNLNSGDINFFSL